MAFEEDTDFDFRKNAQGKISELKSQVDRLTDRCGGIKDTLCAKEKSDGSFEIDFVKLADRLGLEGALELRAAIDERWRISGAVGEKPRVRVQAA